MKLWYLRSAIWLAAVVGSASLHAQKLPESSAAPPGGDFNLLTQTALQQGMLNCVGRINQVGKFVGFGPQAGAILMAPGEHPDQRLTSFSMEVPSEGSPAYVAATFAPNQANGCGAVYEAIVYWKQSCDALASKEYASLKRIGQMKAAITVLDGGVSTKVFLMPAGSGCLSIKKEVVL